MPKMIPIKLSLLKGAVLTSERLLCLSTRQMQCKTVVMQAPDLNLSTSVFRSADAAEFRAKHRSCGSYNAQLPCWSFQQNSWLSSHALDDAPTKQLLGTKVQSPFLRPFISSIFHFGENQLVLPLINTFDNIAPGFQQFSGNA